MGPPQSDGRLGLAPFSNDIGIAPGATFVTAKVLNRNGSGSFNQILEGLEFIADLKPTVDIRARSNSWASTNQAETFFVDRADWWIDDFELTTPDDVEPPYFERVRLVPTSAHSGPFALGAVLSDESRIESVGVRYRVNVGDRLEVELLPSGGDAYSGQIPALEAGDSVDYYYVAVDGWVVPNTGTDPLGAPGYGFHSFSVLAPQIVPQPRPCGATGRHYFQGAIVSWSSSATSACGASLGWASSEFTTSPRGSRSRKCRCRSSTATPLPRRWSTTLEVIASLPATSIRLGQTTKPSAAPVRSA